mmetsp:Transcript_96761/g.258661  ORF Transcript_96761/g.258661 Transcript_96761/m.258661 type:complete len:439 (+) Transcript_96761:27-1343(+)
MPLLSEASASSGHGDQDVRRDVDTLFPTFKSEDIFLTVASDKGVAPLVQDVPVAEVPAGDAGSKMVTDMRRMLLQLGHKRRQQVEESLLRRWRSLGRAVNHIATTAALSEDEAVVTFGIRLRLFMKAKEYEEVWHLLHHPPWARAGVQDGDEDLFVAGGELAPEVAGPLPTKLLLRAGRHAEMLLLERELWQLMARVRVAVLDLDADALEAVLRVAGEFGIDCSLEQVFLKELRTLEEESSESESDVAANTGERHAHVRFVGCFWRWVFTWYANCRKRREAPTTGAKDAQPTKAPEALENAFAKPPNADLSTDDGLGTGLSHGSHQAPRSEESVERNAGNSGSSNAPQQESSVADRPATPAGRPALRAMELDEAADSASSQAETADMDAAVDAWFERRSPQGDASSDGGSQGACDGDVDAFVADRLAKLGAIHDLQES